MPTVIYTDHELLARAVVEVAPVSPLAAELVRRFAEDLAAEDAYEASPGRPEPVSVDVAPRPIA